MKKTICLILSIIICSSTFYLLSACNKKTPENLTTASPSSKSNSISATSTLSDQQITNNEGDVGGGVITVQKYRHKFYSVPGTFIDYVDRDNYYEWLLTIDHTSTAEVMVIKQFVQHFNITREQFDRANLEYAKRIQNKLGGIPCMNPKDYANQEDDEVYNADIIFTFDDDLIREYYLSPDYPYLYDIEFERAVANGEYTPQTEVWVDVEQMEAEIIAKYGETEIVPEEPTDVPEEPTNALEEIVTITEETIDALEEAESTQSAETVNAE